MQTLQLRSAADAKPQEIRLPPLEDLSLTAYLPTRGFVRFWARPTSWHPEHGEIENHFGFIGTEETSEVQREEAETLGEIAALALEAMQKRLVQNFDLPYEPAGNVPYRTHAALVAIARLREAETARYSAACDFDWCLDAFGRAGDEMKLFRHTDACDDPSDSDVTPTSRAALAILIELLSQDADIWSRSYAETCEREWQDRQLAPLNDPADAP